MPDVAVIGGGIAGCAAAALLAEAGASVTLYEREDIAAGASGRNSGVLQHPMDPALVPLYEASLELYAGLEHGFTFPAEASGLLVVGTDAAALAAERDAAAAEFPELAPELLEGAALQAAEPALAGDLCACRLDTGRPVPPWAATRAWAERARAAGAEIVVGASASVAPGPAVSTGGRTVPADAVVVAAGPWTAAALVSATWHAVVARWGVVAQVRLEQPPRHSIEQAGVKAVKEPDGPSSLFSIVTADGASAVGSTFTPDEPDATAVAPVLLERGARYVPALENARIESVRACARPLSFDGRPLLGPVPGLDGVHLVTGHGPWGISLGPGSAQAVVKGVLGEDAAIAPELAAARFGAP
ncbi:MAG TPA: FAD-dependent oxidoreductase [Solirubrobacteraceae bacterium]|nr:FAD-dependent oxidoreductase [Solirubrobacteraceae bacterium]